MIKMLLPSYVFFVSAFFICFINKRWRNVVALSTPFASYILFLVVKGKIISVNFLENELTIFFANKLNTPFFYVFLIISFLGFLYILHSENKKEFIFPMLYAGSSVGLLFCNDFLSLYIFWELMALTSTMVVWMANDERSYKAGIRYFLVHLFGGFLLLSGILLFYNETGSFAFKELDFNKLYSKLILLSFIINAAVPPFSAWLPDAYPTSTIGGSVFLSAFTTKSAVYVLLKFFAGSEILVILGSVMAVFGVIYAFLVLDMRRLLSYHIISQVGFMVTGVGLGTELAQNGAIAHAFTHIIYKGLLFMSVGGIIYVTDKEKLTELGGLLSSQRVLFLYYMVGALSISGFPFLSGFVSKSLTITVSQELHKNFPWLMLNIATTGTFISVALKLPYLAFIKDDRQINAVTKIPVNMHISMIIASLLCVLIGLFPMIFYQILPFNVFYEPYTYEHLIFTFELFLGAFIAFYLYAEKIEKGHYYTVLDFDWIYRRGTKLILRAFYFIIDSLNIFLKQALEKGYVSIIWFLRNPVVALNIFFKTFLFLIGFKKVRVEIEKEIKKYPEDTVKHWPIGVTILYVTILLLLFLMVYYII